MSQISLKTQWQLLIQKLVWTIVNFRSIPTIIFNLQDVKLFNEILAENKLKIKQITTLFT
ncbi:hypothetical protein BpHYR1_026440 [Brachionus plicatilis]|uniref:Uncharacterized protein n=1 Tax=Brachionus plicatilis TaxID=10195 RepID=A0A3M7S848_BRAPC|nr:hypothetical protein BpHYR1_026440 [Brachionus plicatilis]